MGLKTWISIGAAVVVLGTGAGLAIAMSSHHAPVASGATVLPPPPTAPPTTATPPPTCPLTGTPAPGGQVPQRPAVAVKVDNYPSARPQSGLNQADVVFEEPVEGFITRYVAVFQCAQASAFVGPVRSARAVDVQILDELSNPLFFHVGGIDPVISLINSANDNNLDLGTRGHAIEENPPGRVPPYDDYINTTAAWGLDSSDTTPPAALFTYGAAPAGTPVHQVHIPFSSTNDETWTWDAANNGWGLAYSGEPAGVAGGGQLKPTNVVVQVVSVTMGPWVENSGGSLEVQSQMTGSGPAEIFRNGQEITGTWQRPSLTSPTTFVASNGAVIPLAPGQTWIDIVPSTIPVTAS